MTTKKSSAAPTAKTKPTNQPKPRGPATPRIPPAHGGIQYNACKNPRCRNFGVPAPEIAKRAVQGDYAISSGGKDMPLLRCNVCGETPPLKSNVGIVEEIERLGAYLREEEPPFCPNGEPDPKTGAICPNHATKTPYGTKKAYQSYGTNAHGSRRAKCNGCGKTFVVATRPDRGQHDTHLNREIFSLLVNKMPMSRLVRHLKISWEVLYHRIDFIHAQCMAFAARRERRLKTMPVRRLYIGIDAQDYHLNWTERADKRNVTLKALTAVDNRTGYAFINALNFDDSVDRDAVEADAEARGDNLLPPPRRRHARHWLATDYAKSVRETAKRGKPTPAASLFEKVVRRYAESARREDVEVFDEKVAVERLPDRGMQIHSEYTMIALFHHLKGMLGNVGAWRFFLDQESGIRAACLSAFADEVRERRVEAFYVKIEKELVQEEKRNLVDEAKARFAKAMAAAVKEAKENGKEPPKEDDVKLLLLKEEIAKQRKAGVFGDAWVKTPLPTMSEPEKAVCWLTAHDGFLLPDGTPDENHVAFLHAKASLHAVDNFFMKTRRSLYMCERPITSSSNKGRKWSQYQPYDPSVLKKMLEVFRVCHNFVDLPARKKGKKTGVPLPPQTPAMRLGLADAPLDYKDILYFQG